MLLPRHAFREYDVRAVADRDLTDDLARGLGHAFASILAERAGAPVRLALARDCRLSSSRLHAALLRGLTEGGAAVVDLGVGPTPMLYFGVHHLGTDGGVMITGSHNPADENGFKMMIGKAPFFGADIQLLADRIAQGSPVVGGGSVEAVSVKAPYLDALTSRTRAFGRKVKVVLDAGNGAGGPLGLEALELAGAEVIPLFCDMDGRFPNHHPDPTELHNLEHLIAKVRSEGADLGLAFDGDADRLGAVDAQGNVIWGDKLLLLFARTILAEHPGASILGEVKCSQTTYDDIAKHGGKPVMWKTGHSLIKTKMKEEHALLAGEMSGHLFFADRWFGFDDALYGALRLVEIVASGQRTLGELLADVPRTSVTPELRVPCADDVKTRVVAGVAAHYRGKHEVIEVDGARILFGNGAWGLVRASNTQPVLVLRFEADTDARRDALRAEVEGVVARVKSSLSA